MNAQVLILWDDLAPQAFDLLLAEVQVIGPIGLQEDWCTPLENADAALIAVQYQFTAQVLDRAPRLRVIGRPGIGVDNVDIPAATERGICVVNTPDAPTEPVAEKVIGWMLAFAHRLFDANQVARASGWPGRSRLQGNDLIGKTLGLVGLGRVGSRVAQICSGAFGMRVVVYDPYASAARPRECNAELVSLNELLRASDFVSLHCPLTDETRGLIGANELHAMKPTAFLINSARAPIVVETALVQALRERWIAGAALDVFPSEPPPPDHPLLTMDNVLLAPHVGSFTRESVVRMSVESAAQVLQVLRGERPPNLVNPSVWENRRRG